ncbi:hypothetical protein [Granulibacter bethesdensis]|uniref:hypothetical protein n=1 Tax=Granulibacter bethesdensis TaxID=364410 RepID=UPI000909C7A9|nr:hypothetical protein [Granulibacter bethesdensis]APH59872.1 Glycosyltransferase [Granulibacter bethesdensis]
MTQVHCFTSASFSYLDRVRVLGETLKRYHPDWKFWLCLSDQEPEGFMFDLASEPIDGVVRIEELGIPSPQSWIFEHDIVELCTAVKGLMLVRLLDGGADKVVYLDPDIAIFSDLQPIVDWLDTYDILLTPHQLLPDTKKEAVIDNEIASLAYGIYNLGFVSVANRDEGYRFAQWWRDRLLDFCFDDVPRGLFTDQKWCDHVPAFFDKVHIIKDSGYNVASWNLNQRPLVLNSAGDLLAGNQLLRFFHFTKVTWVGEQMLERYANDRVEVFELMAWYKNLLKKHKVVGLPGRWWAFDSYQSGKKIAKEHRILYRNKPDLRAMYPQPFMSGPGSFEAYLETLSD